MVFKVTLVTSGVTLLRYVTFLSYMRYVKLGTSCKGTIVKGPLIRIGIRTQQSPRIWDRHLHTRATGYSSSDSSGIVVDSRFEELALQDEQHSADDGGCKFDDYYEH
jgi:hypothetical protein